MPFDLSSFIVECNGRNYLSGAAASTADIILAPPNVSIIGGRPGYIASSGFTAPKGLYVDICASKLSIIGRRVPVGAVVNDSTDADQTWFGVPGTPDRRPLAS